MMQKMGGPPKTMGWVTGQFWKGGMRAIISGGEHQGKASQGQVDYRLLNGLTVSTNQEANRRIWRRFTGHSCLEASEQC